MIVCWDDLDGGCIPWGGGWGLRRGTKYFPAKWPPAERQDASAPRILKLRARPDLREQRRLQADQGSLFCHILSDCRSMSRKLLAQGDAEEGSLRCEAVQHLPLAAC